MIKRNIEDYMMDWKNRTTRKPLIVRGARQVGKTFTIKKFGEKNFNSTIYINLERPEHKELFDEKLSLSKIIELIQLKFETRLTYGKTLLFIDEIQESIIAMKMLRYFYEDYPQLHVIAAGSLLEIKIKKQGFSFPVGRVEYCYMFPLTFDEFISATGNDMLLSKIKTIDIGSDIPEALHKMCLDKYYEYLVIGGMPEAVVKFIETKSLIESNNICDSIITGYLDDVYKYSTTAKAKYIQHVLAHAPENSGSLIKYTNFGNSAYASREIKEAINTLERAMILTCINASYSLKIPLLHNFKKASKLIFFDTGLVNYQLGLQNELIKKNNDINNIYKGQIAEQAVGQALLAEFRSNKLGYWYRDKKGAVSEVDFIIQHQGALIPVEVKSGKTGHLKSLHIFMQESNNKLAMRIYSGNINIRNIDYLNKSGSYKLISLPFYLLFRIKDFM